MKLELPEKSDRSIKTAQDKFEEFLIDYGLLKTGVEASGDEVTRSIDEHASAAAQSIRKSTAECVFIPSCAACHSSTVVS